MSYDQFRIALPVYRLRPALNPGRSSPRPSWRPVSLVLRSTSRASPRTRVADLPNRTYLATFVRYSNSPRPITVSFARPRPPPALYTTPFTTSTRSPAISSFTTRPGPFATFTRLTSSSTTSGRSSHHLVRDLHPLRYLVRDLRPLSR